MRKRGILSFILTLIVGAIIILAIIKFTGADEVIMLLFDIIMESVNEFRLD